MNAIVALRRTARIWSIGSFAFIAAFALANRGFPVSTEALLFPFGVLAGLAFAWRWEGVGGAIAVASLAAFYLWEAAAAGKPPGGPYFLLVAGPGFLFLAAQLLNTTRKRRGAASASP